MLDLSSIFLLQPDIKDAVWEFYHANTKLSPHHLPPLSLQDDPVMKLNSILRKNLVEEIETAVGTGGKRYATSEKIPLPWEFPGSMNKAYRKVLEDRASTREFLPSSLHLRSIAAILRLANGNKSRDCIGQDERLAPSRYAPSAGALYPLEVYLLSCLPLRGKKSSSMPGVWHFEPQANCLERVACCAPAQIRDCFQAWPESPPPYVVLITGIPKRQSWKYGPRAYRYTLLEAGHAAQNVLLGAAALGFHACPVVGFYDDFMHNLLDIDGVSEIALYCIYVGKKRHSTMMERKRRMKK